MISKTTSNYSLFIEKTTGAWSVVFLFLGCIKYTTLVNIITLQGTKRTLTGELRPNC
jgi:hypothetical protein